MEKILFPDAGPIERLAYLKDNADETVEKFSYDRELDEDELASLKDDFIKNILSIAEKKEELAEFIKSEKAAIKPTELLVSMQRKTIKRGKESTTEDVYAFHDHGAQMVGYYNCDGILVDSRRMTATEKKAGMASTFKFAQTGS